MAGQLGNGSSALELSSNVPVQAVGLTDVVSIAGGWGHSLAARADGTIWAWGINQLGQLGLGATSPSIVRAPVQIPAYSGAQMVTAHFYHSAALRTDGTVWTWGTNQYNDVAYGLLGVGTDVNHYSPVQAGSLGGVTQIDAGGYTALARDTNGNAWAWGYNGGGQVGNGVHGFNPVLSPTRVVAP